MKKSLIALAVLAVFAGATRARTLDAALTYRMGAGNPGDVTRAHPAGIVARLQDAANPVRLYGDAVVYSATAGQVRGVIAADQAASTKIKGVAVRPGNISQTSGGMTATFGVASPPVGNVALDVLEDGFIMVKCNNFAVNAPVLGGQVFVWAAASAGAHVIGGFEAATSAGSTFTVANAEWVSPADANGIAELRVWRA